MYAGTRSSSSPRRRPVPWARAVTNPGGPLNADPADQLRLLDLQALDSRLAQLQHRRTSLPEHTELQRLSDELATVRDARVAAETLATDITREQDKFEADITQVRQRMARDEQRMTAGAVSSAKELESLQHEVDSLHRRQNDLEDGELEVMERLESVEGELAGLTERSASLEAEVADVQRRRDESLAQIADEEASTLAEREQLAPSLPGDLLALYDKLRAQLGGVGAAALRQKRCEGCRLELNAIEFGRVRSAAEDEVLRCEECRRILVRTDESGL